MAGESPDKSEQQKSSGTARSESDPRLAVFREEPAERTGSEDAGADEAASGKPDTATAVFGTKPTAGEGKADTATAVFGTKPAADEGKTDTATAVFSTKSVKDDASEDAEGVPGADGGVSEGGEDGSGGGADVSGGAADSEGAEEAAGAADAGTGAKGRDAAPEASEGVAGREEAAEGEASSNASDASGDAEAASREEEPEAEAEVKAEADAEDKPKPEPVTKAEDEKAEEPEKADAKAAAKPEGKADSKAEAKADSKAEESAAEDKAEPKPKDKDEGKGKGEEAGKDKAGDDAADAGDKRADARADADADTDTDTDDKRGVDQPTAIFRAPAPRVDQPTTALKIAPPESKAATKSGTKPDAKADAESASKPEGAPGRTSTFVPLRGDDVPQAKTPTPAPASVPAPGRPGAPAGAAAAEPASLAPAERTTQQPMPPKAPLDLLAELTNTPPPPETPVRTAVRRVKIWTPLVLLLLIVFAIVQMVRPLPTPEPKLSVDPAYTFSGGRLNLTWPEQGQSAVTVDGVGTMGSAGAQKPAPIASVAKVMTAYVVLQGHPLKGKEEGEKITVDQQAEDESNRDDESTAPIKKGQQFTQKQLLQLLMIPSGNNAARLFARWDAPSEKEFVAKMNAAAKDLGMTNTTYTDPSGLDKGTVSTAEDQLKLARAVMQNDVFRGIVDTPQINIPGIDQTIYNNNTILLEPGVSGIKTGSSTPAGGNLLWSANTVVDGKTLWIYGAVMGQQAGTGQPYDSLKMSLDNSLELIKDAQKAVTSARVVKKGDVVGYVDDGLGGHTPLVATRDLKAKGWPGLKVELSVSNDGKEIPHEAAAGTEVGVVTVGTGPGMVSAPVALQSELKAPGVSQKLTRIS
ncbi:serine hydrolase [Streptomyces sp. NPDC059913]|uniref:serine hydrolase n=1 Tax=unclassified Streptomyces TaxID=2593676 RepID=UPI00365BF788